MGWLEYRVDGRVDISGGACTEFHDISYGYDKYDVDLKKILCGKTIDLISKKYFIEIFDAQIDPSVKKERNNASQYIGTSIINKYDLNHRKEIPCLKSITFGKFRNSDKKLAAFFHELGHFAILPESNNWNILKSELFASIIGFQIARDEGVKISRRAEIWIMKGLISYVRKFGILTNEDI